MLSVSFVMSNVRSPVMSTSTARVRLVTTPTPLSLALILTLPVPVNATPSTESASAWAPVSTRVWPDARLMVLLLSVVTVVEAATPSRVKVATPVIAFTATVISPVAVPEKVTVEPVSVTTKVFDTTGAGVPPPPPPPARASPAPATANATGEKPPASRPTEASTCVGATTVVTSAEVTDAGAAGPAGTVA